MKNQKLINNICNMLTNMNKPLNQKIEIRWRLDKANTKELKQIETELNAEIISDISKAFILGIKIPIINKISANKIKFCIFSFFIVYHKI